MYTGTGKGFFFTHKKKKKKKKKKGTTNNNNKSVDRFISAHQKMQSNELVISEKEIILYTGDCSLVLCIVFQACIIKALLVRLTHFSVCFSLQYDQAETKDY